MSAKLLVARTRGLVRRRFSNSAPPTSVITPQAPPAIIASFCFTSIGRKASYIQCGVSMPRKCPAKIPKIPIWNRLEANRMPLLSSIWLEPARQLYCP
ncbi:hypothetical protein D3C71_1431070 [compost metagenome]